jgi:hypothetical protein
MNRTSIYSCFGRDSLGTGGTKLPVPVLERILRDEEIHRNAPCGAPDSRLIGVLIQGIGSPPSSIGPRFRDLRWTVLNLGSWLPRINQIYQRFCPYDESKM